MFTAQWEPIRNPFSVKKAISWTEGEIQLQEIAKFACLTHSRQLFKMPKWLIIQDVGGNAEKRL